jgi:hypothetical protein
MLFRLTCFLFEIRCGWSRFWRDSERRPVAFDMRGSQIENDMIGCNLFVNEDGSLEPWGNLASTIKLL